jgi:hypothetical protein
MTLAEHISHHALSAIRCYEAFGVLLPKLWAASRRVTLIAEPNPQTPVHEADQSLLLAAMKQHIHARYLGRSDEVWCANSSYLLGASLAALADTDPNIYTGLSIVGIDTKQRTANGSIMQLFLTDDGSSKWRASPLSEFAANKVLQPIFDAEHLTVKASLRELATDLQWNYVMTITPKGTRRER